MANIAVYDTKEDKKEIWSPVSFLDERCRRTLDDFKNFCSFILAYEASLEGTCHEDSSCEIHSCHSPSGSSTASCTSTEDSLNDERRLSKSLPLKRSHENEEYDSDHESWNAVTCYCEKPFAGRPMIECSQCLTWIHLSCAKIRKSNIPELFVCHLCRDRNPRVTNFLSHSNNNLIQHPDRTKRKSDPSQRRRPKLSKNRKKDYLSREQDPVSFVS